MAAVLVAILMPPAAGEQRLIRRGHIVSLIRAAAGSSQSERSHQHKRTRKHLHANPRENSITVNTIGLSVCQTIKVLALLVV
jgi:hypothetical protein